MRLFGFELKKLFMNRILVIGLLLLTLVSSCLYFLEAKPKEDPLMPYLDAYMEYYSKDPDKARAEADALRQRSELDYTKEVLEIYSAHIVQPLKDQIALTNKRLDLYEYAINQAPTCKLYPNCPVLLSVQSKKHNVISPQLSTD